MLVATAGGQVYKWTDENGKTHFGDRPPVEAAPEQVEIKVNSVVGPPTVATPNQDTMRAAQKGPAKRVTMYSAKWCGVCKTAATYFRSNNIRFTEYDIESSAKGKREYKKLGRGGVPIIQVGGKIMRGFSAAKFSSLYNPN